MSPKPLHQLLRVISHLLDQAASNTRDADLEPVSDNIERIGRALVEVLDVQRQIHAVLPALKPKSLVASPLERDACSALTHSMIEALELEDRGQAAAAIARYEEFIGVSCSFAHREIARAQVRRLSLCRVSACS